MLAALWIAFAKLLLFERCTYSDSSNLLTKKNFLVLSFSRILKFSSILMTDASAFEAFSSKIIIYSFLFLSRLDRYFYFSSRSLANREALNSLSLICWCFSDNSTSLFDSSSGLDLYNFSSKSEAFSAFAYAESSRSSISRCLIRKFIRDSSLSVKLSDMSCILWFNSNN